MAQAVAAYCCALEVYTPEGFPAYHVRVEANLAQSDTHVKEVVETYFDGAIERTCLNRRRPLSERDFPSLAYISSSRTRVLKHHPGQCRPRAPRRAPVIR